MTKALKIIRWILVIPISLSVILLIAWFSSEILKTPLDNTMPTAIKRGATILVATITSIILSSLIAPAYKFRVSFLVALVWVVVLLLCVSVVVFGDFNGTEQFILDGGVGIISTIIGVIVALLISKKINSRKSQLTD